MSAIFSKTSTKQFGMAEDFFLGTIVFVSDGIGEPSIADGQQRPATTTIFLCRIRDRLFSMGRARASDRSIWISFGALIENPKRCVLA